MADVLQIFAAHTACRKDGSYDNMFLYVSLMPYSEILEQLQGLAASFTSVGVVILILSLPLSFFIFHHIYKPVGTMAKYLSKFAQTKDLNLQIPEDRSDEFGVMFRAFNKMTGQVRTLVQELYVKSLLLKDAELMALQSQINPHFLYNTLNTVSCLSLRGKNEEVAHVIASLSDFMRLSLNDGKPLISIQKTLDQIWSYITIQSVRFPGRIRFTSDVDPSLFDLELPTLLIQPLIENSVLHGMRDDEPIEIHLSIHCTDEGFLCIRQSDDGVGISPHQLWQIQEALAEDKETTGSFYALRNINSRIRLTYGDEYGLAMSSAPGEGACCTIVVPLQEAERERIACVQVAHSR